MPLASKDLPPSTSCGKQLVTWREELYSLQGDEHGEKKKMHYITIKQTDEFNVQQRFFVRTWGTSSIC
jgi:hypothetical protein